MSLMAATNLYLSPHISLVSFFAAALSTGQELESTVYRIT